jgi:hypothetical protein
MGNRGRAGILAAAALLLAASGVQGQDRWKVDLRAGGGVPTDDLGDAKLDGGLGLDGSLAVRVQPHLWVYAGWGWHQLAPDYAPWGADSDLTQTGYRAGLQWAHPLLGESGNGVGVWLEAGATLEHLELENADGDPIQDTDHGAGWEAGGGFSLPVWGGWTLTPGARYRGLSRELTFDGLKPEVYLQYVALEVGVSRTF